MAQPRMQASVKGTPTGAGKTSLAGTTAYSANPPILYIANVVPSLRQSRLVPSYRGPPRRYIAKNVSHRSPRPRTQYWQPPNGMMNLQTTAPLGCTVLTSGATISTTPEISCPSTQGRGNCTSPLTTCKSVWQTPQAATRTNASPALGEGVGMSSMVIGPPTADSTAAFMRRLPRVGYSPPARLQPSGGQFGPGTYRVFLCPPAPCAGR